MDELIDLVVEKTGISKEEATQAVLSGDVDVKDLTEGLGGLLGGND